MILYYERKFINNKKYMNIYIFKPIFLQIRDKYFDFKIFIKYRSSFLVAKIITLFRIRFKGKKENYNDNYIHICNQHNKSNKSWETYKVRYLLRYKHRNKYIKKKNYINFIRLIAPSGIHKINKLTIKYKKENYKLVNYEEFGLKRKDFQNYQNLKYYDILINSKLRELSIDSKNVPITYQEIFKSALNVKESTVFIILDAADFENLKKMNAYKKYISHRKHLLSKTYAPSSLTISSLPSLLTLQPVIQHLNGELGPFYKHSIDQITPFNKTIPEMISEYIDYSIGFTTFAKTTNTRSFNKGFSSYYYRNFEKSYSPSSLDNFMMYLKEHEYFFKSIDSFFAFIHDSGAHPGYHPFISIEKDQLNNSNFSYEYTYNLSLNKVASLLSYLEMFNKLETTNIIITGDHTKTDNRIFNVFENNLLPSRLEVPVLFIPSKKISLNNFEILEKEFSIMQPSINLIANILRSIYPIKLKIPSFTFSGFSWFSAQYNYPKMEEIYILGYSDKFYSYFQAIVPTALMHKSINLSDSRFIQIFKFEKQNFVEISNKELISKVILKSLIAYIKNCRKNTSKISKMRDLDFC